MFTVTNSAELVGSLEVEVPQDATTTNTRMALTGNLKFVKTGPGTFVVKKDHQTFTGGTQVAAGTLKYAAEPAYWPLGGNGTTDVSAQLVTVDDGATLDINGYGGFGYTTVVFNGGTVKGTTGLFNCARSLTADSYLETTGDFNMQYNDFLLNGYTLEVAIANEKNLKFQDLAPQGPGKIKIISGGWFQTLTSACNATNVDFIVGSALNLGTALSVHDYEAGGVQPRLQQRYGGAERVRRVQAVRARLLLRLHDAGRLDDRPFVADECAAARLSVHGRGQHAQVRHQRDCQGRAGRKESLAKRADRQLGDRSRKSRGAQVR